MPCEVSTHRHGSSHLDASVAHIHRAFANLRTSNESNTCRLAIKLQQTVEVLEPELWLVDILLSKDAISQEIAQACSHHTYASTHIQVVDPVSVVLHAQHLCARSCGECSYSDPRGQMTIFSAKDRSRSKGKSSMARWERMVVCSIGASLLDSLLEYFRRTTGDGKRHSISHQHTLHLRTALYTCSLHHPRGS